MKEQANRILGNQRANYDDVKKPSTQPVPQGGELTFVPMVQGIEFSPPRRTFTWRKSVHREEFDMWVAAEIEDQTLSGRLTVFLGSLVIAEVALVITVDRNATSQAERVSVDEPMSARRVRQVYASYSRMDEPVVAELAQVAPLFGTRFVTDRTHLEPGEDRREGLQRLIRGADMFQLFWSSNSMRSADTVDEIKYAASLGRPGFILPTYWEEPLPRSPAENLPPPEIDRLQFHRIFPGAISPAPLDGKLSRLVILAPVDSEIFLDDERQGSTGRSGRLIISSPKAGKHTLRFAKRGYPDDEQIVDIKDGVDEQVVQAHFQPAKIFGPASAESVTPSYRASRPKSAAHGENFERVDVVPTGELGPIDQAVADTAPLEAPPEVRAAIEAPETPEVTAPLEVPRSDSPTRELPPLLETLPAPQPAFAAGAGSAPTFGTVVCSTCRMIYPAGMKFCGSCGGTLVKAKVPDPIYHAPEAVLTSPTQSFQAPSVPPRTVQARPVAARRRIPMMPIYGGAAMVLLAIILVPAWLMMSLNQKPNSTTLPSATPQYTTEQNSDGSANSNTSSSQPGPTVTAGIQFVYIPPGKFTMGSENGEADEKPVHQVTINYSFYIGKYEVTQAQSQTVMGDNPSSFKDCSDCPVDNVSWDDAQRFIQRLNGMNDGYSYRLPTEAEWEYACRAGTTGNYAGDVKEMAWYSENSGKRTHIVGGKQPNAWGLFDMHGNVWEWCQDWYHETYDGAPADGSAWLNGGGQKFRVLRGGAWLYDAPRSAERSYTSTDLRSITDGVRVVARAKAE
jgi:formylglycine-generating enzyme required for sulfatase activity